MTNLPAFGAIALLGARDRSNDELRDYAGLDKKAVLVGQGNKMELWDEDTWLAERDKWLQMASVEGAVPDEMLRLSL